MENKTNGVAERKPSEFEAQLAIYEPQIVAALPSHIPVERFKRVVITALNQNSALAKADRRTLFTACIRAAQDGLLPDGREAALVIYGQTVQYLPMIQGIRKRMRNTGDVSSAEAHVIYEADEFDYRLGDDPFITHKPALTDRGKPVGAYAIIKLSNGEVLREVMSYAQIEQVRAVSKAAKNGPWVTWWDEMARKSVLRRCAKAAPNSADIEELLKRDDEADAAAEHASVSLPARPTRDRTPETRDAEPFYVATGDGQEISYEDPKNAAEAFSEMLNGAETRDALDGIWESNTLSGQFRDRGHAELANKLHETYAQKTEAFTKPVEAKTEEKPTEPQFPASPLKSKKAAEWPAWVDWVAQNIGKMSPLQRSKYLTDHEKEFAFVRENRAADAQRIDQILDGLRAETAAK